jgi:hypothetical protein
MYDVSATGAVGAPIVSVDITTDVWESTVMSNAAGNALIAVNGQDDGIIYDSGGVARIVAGDGIVANTWDGIDPKDALCPTIHQHRLWVIEKGTTRAWYLPPDAVQGTFVAYDFGPLFKHGGYLQILCTWTLDDGSGATDHLIGLSSEGEAVVYAGTDPDNDLLWGLTGVYFIGTPVAGRRGFAKVGGDIYILSNHGVVSMTTLLTSTSVKETSNKMPSDKIQFLVSELVADFSNLFGWDMKYFPKYDMLMMNVPGSASGGNIQLAANGITGAWTEFVSMDATCWAQFGSDMMFADYDGNVNIGWVGNVDAAEVDGSDGTAIVSNVQQAYTYAGAPATQKQIGMYQPVFVVSNSIAISTNIQYDFATDNITTPDVAPQDLTSLWGVGLWGTSLWGGGDSVQKQWIQANGMGVAASLRMVAQTEADVLWVATNYSFISGPGLL